MGNKYLKLTSNNQILFQILWVLDNGHVSHECPLNNMFYPNIVFQLPHISHFMSVEKEMVIGQCLYQFTTWKMTNLINERKNYI